MDNTKYQWNMELTKEKYKTNNFYLASFLLAKEFVLSDIVRTNGNKNSFFVFVSSENLTKTVNKFKFSEENNEDLMVDGRKLIYSIKKLKDNLYLNK